ncbi:MAG: hypothetical protein KA911_05535, partial [Xanthomonadales bacterium]|nr:hypothetical protein [Xanthomonadales bacterium]
RGQALRLRGVIPAQAGIHLSGRGRKMDSRLRGNDAGSVHGVKRVAAPSQGFIPAQAGIRLPCASNKRFAAGSRPAPG